MQGISPPEVLNQDSVTIVRLGADYANFYENLLPNLSFMQPLAQSINPPRLVVDMQHVKFVGSAFLGFMVSVHKTLAVRESGRFALCGLSPFCRSAVSVSKLDRVFEVFDTMEDAVRAFSEDPGIAVH
jgi:anti-anti-sigma factor